MSSSSTASTTKKSLKATKTTKPKKNKATKTTVKAEETVKIESKSRFVYRYLYRSITKTELLSVVESETGECKQIEFIPSCSHANEDANRKRKIEEEWSQLVTPSSKIIDSFARIVRPSLNTFKIPRLSVVKSESVKNETATSAELVTAKSSNCWFESVTYQSSSVKMVRGGQDRDVVDLPSVIAGRERPSSQSSWFDSPMRLALWASIGC